jgi:hypothetical protein
MRGIRSRIEAFRRNRLKNRSLAVMYVNRVKKDILLPVFTASVLGIIP